MTGWPLEPGEQLRWEGRPDSGFSLAPVAKTVWQLVLVWSGCAVLAVVIMAFAGATEFAGLMLAGFAVLIALQVLIVGWWNMRARGNADYAVTDRRVLIRNRRQPAFGRAITPFDPEMVTLRPTSPPGVLIGRGPLLFSGEAGAPWPPPRISAWTWWRRPSMWHSWCARQPAATPPTRPTRSTALP